MANLFVISDTHFGHENIIGYCQRPFANAREMDEAMVERWNAVVRPQDHVYHLGDVAMRKPALATVARLHGHKRLVCGNHDIYDVKDYLACGFQKVSGLRVIDGLLFSHIPVHVASLGRFAANVHGHIHNAPTYEGRYINVSVEVVNYTPVALEELARRARGFVVAADAGTD